jgi:hypothetical protein
VIKFSSQPFIDCAKILVEADETELAIRVLNSLPAYYRENIPEDIDKLKNLIQERITMAYDLLSDHRELPKSDEWSAHFLNNTERGLQLKKLVTDYNSADISPHIVDMGPGDFTFVIGMKSEDLSFSYECFTLNKEAEKAIKQKLGSIYQKSRYHENAIFVA